MKQGILGEKMPSLELFDFKGLEKSTAGVNILPYERAKCRHQALVAFSQ